MAKRKLERKSGYWVYLYGDRYWHRTLEGARKRVNAPENFYARSDAQIISVKTGKEMKHR